MDIYGEKCLDNRHGSNNPLDSQLPGPLEAGKLSNNSSLKLYEEKRHLSIFQYNCQKNWSRVLASLRSTAYKADSLPYDILAFQEPLSFDDTDKTQSFLASIPRDIDSQFELVVGPPAPGIRKTTQRNPRCCFFINRRLSKAPWHGWSRFFLGSDILTIAIPSESKEDKRSSVLFIHNIYINPSKDDVSTIDKLKQLLLDIERDKAYHSSKMKDHIILGDFNIHAPIWGGANAKTGSKFPNIIPVIERLNLYLLLTPGSITHPGSHKNKGSTIDLIFATLAISERLLYCQARPDLNERAENNKLSDHVPIETVLDLSLYSKSYIIPRNWKVMDERALLEALRENLWLVSVPPVTNDEIDIYTRDLVNALKFSIHQSTPLIRPSSYSRSWWNEDIKGLRKSTQKLRRQVQKSRKSKAEEPDESILSEWKRARNAKSRMCKNLKDQDTRQRFEKAAENKIQLEKEARWVERRQTPFHAHAAICSIFGYDPKKMADALATQFLPIQREVDLSEVRTSANPATPEPLRQLIEDEVRQAIQRCKPGISPGPDGIPSEVIKLAQPLILEPLFRLFEASLVHGYCPKHFREVSVFVYPKQNQGNYTSLDAYGPIVMRNTLSKILESIVARWISDLAQQLGLIHANHYDSRSRDLARQDLLQHIYLAKRGRNNASLLLIDAPKAFENVSHGRLIYILQKGRFPDKLINWIHSFISNRHFTFLVPGQTEEYSVTQETCDFGIPFGSPVSEILYLIYTSSLLEITNGSSWSITIDTTLGILSTSTSTAENCSTLAKQHHEIEQWTRTHGSVFRLQNCRLIHFDTDTKSRLIELRLDNLSIQPRNSVEFLGLTLEYNLRWRAHIRSVEQNITRDLGSLHAIARSTAHMRPRLIANIVGKFVVPSVLELSSPLLHPDGESPSTTQKKTVDKTTTKAFDRTILLFSRDFEKPLEFPVDWRPPIIEIPHSRSMAINRHATTTRDESALSLYSRGYQKSRHLAAAACAVNPSKQEVKYLGITSGTFDDLHCLSELHGILEALKLATSISCAFFSKIVIFSNSQKAIQYLQFPIMRFSSSLFSKINDCLKSLLLPVYLVWIPSKSKITGNNIAFDLARTAVLLRQEQTLRVMAGS